MVLQPEKQNSMQKPDSNTVFKLPALNSSRRFRFPTLSRFVAGAAALVALNAFAQSGDPTTQCEKVGGALSTNFIAPDQTAGTATGDLKGALGVKILATVSGTVGDGKPVKLKVLHFWVTETGDTILTDEAELTAYPGLSPSQPLLYSAVYEKGLKVTGGTGKFEGAAGSLKVWAAVDLGAGQVAGRYSGTICFKVPTASPAVGTASIQDGQFRFVVQAPGAREVVAEASSNLKDWERLAAQAPVNGAAEFRDPSVATTPQRFYRAKAE